MNDKVLTADTDFSAMIKIRKNRLRESFHLQTTLMCLKARAVSSPESKSITSFFWLYYLHKYALCAQYFKLRCHSRTDVKSCSSFPPYSEILNTLLTHLSKSGLESKVFSLLTDIKGIIP